MMSPDWRFADDSTYKSNLHTNITTIIATLFSRYFNVQCAHHIVRIVFAGLFASGVIQHRCRCRRGGDVVVRVLFR